MGTKVKGLLKGLRYISQIFDEPKRQQEMKIGLPTDVKHVAHIGWDDGPAAVDSSPSWMKGFESTEGVRQLAPSCIEDSTKRIVHRASNSLGDDQPDKPRSTRRTSSLDDSPRTDSPKREKSRHSRRHHRKDSLGNSKLSQEGTAVSDSPGRDSRRHHRKDSLGNSKLSQEGTAVSDSPGRDLPDIPRKTRKDSLGNSKLSQEGNVVSDSPGRDLPDIPRKTRRKKSRDSRSSRPSKPRGSGSEFELDSSVKSRSTKDKESSEAGC